MNYTDEQLLHLIRAGRKLEAVKTYKDATKASLYDAKQYVDGLGNGVSFQTPILAGASLDEQLKQLCFDGQKIEAIKRYRDATKCSLKEAKEYVDQLTDDTNETVHNDLAFDNNLAFERPAKKGFWQWLSSLLNGG